MLVVIKGLISVMYTVGSSSLDPQKVLSTL